MPQNLGKHQGTEHGNQHKEQGICDFFRLVVDQTEGKKWKGTDDQNFKGQKKEIMPFVVADYELGFEDNKYRINCYEGDTDCSGQVMHSPKCQRKNK